MYHNTTQSTGAELKVYREKAKSQEDQILEFMLTNQAQGHAVWLPPSKVLEFVFNNSVPITSIRRALTNLTNDGKLVKTSSQWDGPYGRPEFIWKLATKQRELF